MPQHAMVSEGQQTDLGTIDENGASCELAEANTDDATSFEVKIVSTICV